MMKRLAIALFLFTATLPAQAAPQCGAGAVAEFQSIERQVRRSAPACDRAMRGRATDIDLICRKCRSHVLALTRFDRALRRHPGCFANRGGRNLTRDWARYRSGLRFFRRGCGY